jgi:hypothetical protein
MIISYKIKNLQVFNCQVRTADLIKIQKGQIQTQSIHHTLSNKHNNKAVFIKFLYNHYYLPKISELKTKWQNLNF